jgi:hypothetical protein
MWRNLGEAVERTVAKHRACLRELPVLAPVEAEQPSLAPADPGPASSPGPRAGRLPERTRRRHTAVHDLIAQGQPLRAIARELGISRNTVRRFARATDPEELLVNEGTGRRPKALDGYASYLRQRWMDGCTNAEQLLGEIRAMGYRGGGTALRQYVSPWRSSIPPARPPQVPPTVRQATGWILRDPQHLDSGEQQKLDALTAACPPLAAVREHVRGFAVMMLHLQGHHLDGWMAAVQANDLPDLHSFVAGLRRDYDAARAGLTLPHRSGKVEGHVNRIKMLKRQMYGRASPDLLRKRILLSD